MTFPEMMYEVTIFLFSDLWKYLGLLLLVITVRGDITRGLKSIGGFFRRLKENYKRLTTKPSDIPKTKQKIELSR